MFDLFVNNYRGYENQNFSFAKYNIFIGENSGGKSSLLKLIMLLKQSMSDFRSNRLLFFNGSLVCMGSFADIIKNHDKKKQMDVSYTTTPEYRNYLYAREFLTKKSSHKLFDNARVKVSFSFKSDLKIMGTPLLFSCPQIGKITLNPLGAFKEEEYGSVSYRAILIFDDVNTRISYEIPVTVSPNGFMQLVEPQKIYEFKKIKKIKDDLFFDKIAYLLCAQNELDYILGSFSYINPVNFHAERLFLNSMETASFANDYQSAISGLLSIHEDKDAWNSFVTSMKNMGLADNVIIEQYKDSPALQLKTKRGKLKNNVVDVGYGVSLQIPIMMHIVFLKYFRKKSNLIIEQPEIHLHPALQSKFIEELVNNSGSTSFFIETHSEHILRKMQLLCKKKMVKPEDVSIFYFKNDNGKFDISQHSILSTGKIEPLFPKGFFDASFMLSMELMK